MTQPVICAIYRSSKREEMYLYVRKGTDLDTLPEGLRQSFGRPVPVMELLLTPQRRLARADVVRVLEMLEQQGFYLQLPPNPLAGPDHA